MNISVSDSYGEMSKKTADAIIQKLQTVQQPLFCVPSGESPGGLYKEFTRLHNEKLLDISSWYFLGLDEWLGLGKNDEGSCRAMLDRDLFYPLKIKKEQIIFFDGKTNDPEKECESIEEFIHQHGSIDMALLGLGMNGHIGLNEPGTSPLLRSHVSVIDEITQTVGQKYFSKPQQLSKGITLGLATLMEAKNLIVIANGKKKSAIVQQAIEGEITEKIPASLLRHHPQLTYFLDAEAASLCC